MRESDLPNGELGWAEENLDHGHYRLSEAFDHLKSKVETSTQKLDLLRNRAKVPVRFPQEHPAFVGGVLFCCVLGFVLGRRKAKISRSHVEHHGLHFRNRSNRFKNEGMGCR